jgi:hypothetical protein
VAVFSRGGVGAKARRKMALLLSPPPDRQQHRSDNKALGNVPGFFVDGKSTY